MYVKRLLSDLLRKTMERIALEFGENGPDLQHFVGQNPRLYVSSQNQAGQIGYTIQHCAVILEEELKKRPWQPADLARRAGLHSGSVSRILNGTRKAGAEPVQRLKLRLALINGILILPPAQF